MARLSPWVMTPVLVAASPRRAEACCSWWQAGTTTVEAGTTTDGRGIVRVGPYFKCSPITPSTPVMAIPGWTDCIMGSKNAK